MAYPMLNGRNRCEYTTQEIAIALGISERAVMVAYQSAMQKIRVGLEERGISLDDIVHHIEAP